MEILQRDMEHIREQIALYNSTCGMTDDERAKVLGLPEGCRIREDSKILSPNNFKCGKYVWIGEHAVLDASGGLEIGDYTQIGLYTVVYSHTSHKQCMDCKTGINRNGIIRKHTKRGKCGFRGGHCFIYPGVTIGDYATVLPATIVAENVPEGGMIYGNPKQLKLEKRVKRLEDLLEDPEKYHAMV